MKVGFKNRLRLGRGDSGASAMISLVVIGVIGLVLAGLQSRRGHELQALLKQSLHDSVERGEMSALMQTEDMVNPDFGCIGGFASLCSELYVRRICNESAPAGGWSPFASAWWTSIGASGVRDQVIRVARQPARSNWKAQKTAAGVRLTMESPYIESGLSQSQMKDLFTSGRLPGEPGEDVRRAVGQLRAQDSVPSLP